MERSGYDLASMLYKHMSLAEKKYVTAHVECKGDVKAIMKKLKLTVRPVEKMYNREIVRDYLMALKDETGGMKLSVTPTFEWIQNELMSQYESAKDDDKPKILKNITDFRSKFGKYLDEESAKISRMGKKELAEFITKEYNALKNDLKDLMWVEKTRESFEYKVPEDEK